MVNRWLTKEKLRIKIDKCSFFQTSVYLFSFVISRNTTKIDTKNLSSIDSWEEIPKTTKQVRSFMGVISQSRKYCACCVMIGFEIILLPKKGRQ